MDEINIGPKHEWRLPSRRLVAAATALALIAATVTLIMTSGGGRRVHKPKGPSPVAAVPVPSHSPAGAPGTLLLTCDSANWGGLGRDWRAGSVKVGPLWLIGGRHYAYLPGRSPHGIAHPRRGSRKPSGALMIVEVTDGSTVVMKATGSARQFFHFVRGFNGPAGNPLPAGDTGFTLSACPKGDSGPNGPVTDFYLGFSIEAGRAASVDIRPWASSLPIRMVFISPRKRSVTTGSSSGPYSRARELTCGTVRGLHLMPSCPTPLPTCSRYRMAC